MTVKALFDKYCKIEDGEYIVHGHCVTLEPATLYAMTAHFSNGGKKTANALYGWGVSMTIALYMMILIINMGLDLPETRTLESMTL